MSVRNRWPLLVAALSGYGVLWLGWIQQWAWLTAMDSALLATGYRYGVADPVWVRAWQAYCDVFGPWTFQVVAIVIAVVALVRRQRRPAIFLLVCVVLAPLLTEAAKDIAQRHRPLTALAHESSWAFPSGHALGTIVGLLGLTAAALVLAPAWRRGIRIAAGVGAVVVLLVGVGRVALNVHYPSDVLAGWLLGGTWFLATLPVLAGRATSTVQDCV